MGRVPAGLGAVFEPRALVKERAAFGKVGFPIEPAEGVDPASPRYRAAMLQHLLANAVREAVAINGTTVNAHIQSAHGREGLSADRQQRLLRGETMAQYADIAYWASHFPTVALVLIRYVKSWHPALDALDPYDARSSQNRPARSPMR